MAANQAQMLMLLNQVNNLENQMKQGMGLPNMALNQSVNPSMNINPSILAMLGQMQSKGSKNQKSQDKNKVKKENGNPNMANLLAALTGASTPIDDKPPRGRCIWVTGLPESYQDSDKLANVFGNFGNVRKIVYSEKKPDGALIELDDSRGSIKAVVNMNKQKLDGQTINVSFTSIDKAGIKPSDTKSKDMRQAKENWRFSGNKDAKFRRICMSRLRGLTNSVLVSNIPQGKIDQLKKHIIEAGYTVKSMEGSKRPVDESKEKSDYTMSIVELASVEEAIDAVANLHNSWPKKFGTKNKDKFENEKGLTFTLMGKKVEKPKA